MPKFQPNNTIGRTGGRPKGARNKLANCVFEDVLAVWNEPAAEGSTLTKGQEAMLTMWREKPSEFVKSVFSIMPKEFLLENVVTDLADDELDRMIEMLRERVLTAREEQTLELKADELKMIQNAH